MSNPDPEVPALATEAPPYLRRISFLDLVQPAQRGPGAKADLVHIASRILFDGDEISPYVIDLREGWSVGSTGAETLVSFCIRADAVTPPVLNEAGDLHVVPSQIAGKSLLVPRNHAWQEYDRDTEPWPGVVRAAAKMVRVFVYVPEVEIRNAEPGEVKTLGRPVDEVPA